MYLILISILLIFIRKGVAKEVAVPEDFHEKLLFQEIQASIENVARCPQDESEWIKAEKRKNCSKRITDFTEKLVYHCVPNHYQNITVEVCAPVKLIVFGHCVEYSFLGRKVQENYNTNCRQFAVPCPVYYKSNEVYKYQGCYEVLDSLISDDDSVSHIEEPSTAEVEESPHVPIAKEETGEEIHSNQRIKTNSDIDWESILSVGLVLSLMLICLCVVCKWRRKEKEKQDIDKQKLLSSEAKHV